MSISIALRLPRARYISRQSVFRNCLFTTSTIPHHASCAETPARTRFAPSPTGFLHLGSLRTALFNYLLAKKTGGQFLLRIEDTDKKRTVKGAEESLIETLRWAGLQWDEGPDIGGPYGPYRQSERSELHRQHAQQLIDNGHAYRCFCTAERLEALSIARKRSGLPTDYDRTCISIKADESASRAAAGGAHVVRLKTPDQYPVFHDSVYGNITFTENKRAHSLGAFEDPILLKSDGLPTYHLANVVDDHHMNITHVLRATEWMPSTPKHVHLYNCFGWTPPEFVHVGLLQNKERGKLSKRNGDVFVSEFKEKGYLPESLNNFVALLGWSHEQQSDVMNLQEMVERFDTGRLTQGNTIVNFEKLDFLQRQHVMNVSTVEDILGRVQKVVTDMFGDKLENGDPITKEYVRTIFNANLSSFILPQSFVETRAYFFRAPVEFKSNPIKQINRYLSDNNMTYLDLMEFFIAGLEKRSNEDWTYENLHQYVELKDMENRTKWNNKMRLVRLALAGGEHGPTVAQTMAILGKERTMKRLAQVEGILLGTVRKVKIVSGPAKETPGFESEIINAA